MDASVVGCEPLNKDGPVTECKGGGVAVGDPGEGRRRPVQEGKGLVHQTKGQVLPPSGRENPPKQPAAPTWSVLAGVRRGCLSSEPPEPAGPPQLDDASSSYTKCLPPGYADIAYRIT